MTNVACAHVKRKKWECSSQCEPVTDTVVDAILTLKAAFDKPIQEDRHTLDRHTLDNVIVSHYCKVIEFSSEGIRWLVPVVMVAKVN